MLDGTNPFMPHSFCYLWNQKLIWLHAVSDTLVAVAYLSIPITLVHFVRKRRDVPLRLGVWLLRVVHSGLRRHAHH